MPRQSAGGQSGRTNFQPVGGASPRSHFNLRFLQCQDTASRFIEAVRRYRLDWTAVVYSLLATGAFWDTLLVVASGAPVTAQWCPTRSYSASHRHFTTF